MKHLFTLFLLYIGIATNAQSPILWYDFYNNANDNSGNGYDATIEGDAYLWNSYCCACIDGCVTIPSDKFSYVSVPAEALNGLQDFTIRVRLNVHRGPLEGNEPEGMRWTVFSGSSDGCVNCFGMAYSAYYQRWELNLNGQVYYFTDSLFSQGNNAAAKPLQIVRDAGLISVYVGQSNANFKGSVVDGSAINVSTFQLGQRDNCIGGCFNRYQSLSGDIDIFQVWNMPLYPQKQLQELAVESSMNIYPNPADNFFTLTYRLTSSSVVTITNAVGKMEKQFLVDPSSTSMIISTAGLAQGIYFVAIRADDSRVIGKAILSKQ